MTRNCFNATIALTAAAILMNPHQGTSQTTSGTITAAPRAVGAMPPKYQVGMSSSTQVLSPTFPEFMKGIEQSWASISPRIGRNFVAFQQESESRKWSLRFKTIGTTDTVTLDPSGWFCGLPRVSRDATTYYFEATHAAPNTPRYLIALVPGRAPRVVAKLPTKAGNYDFSPDGKELIYQVMDTAGHQLMRMNLLTQKTEEFTDMKSGGVFPAYSPNGQFVAYCSRKKLRIKSVVTGAERVLVDDTVLKELPTWSADGKEIAYQGKIEDGMGYDLYKVRVDTGQTTRLTEMPGNDVNPVFTGDGQFILFTSERETRQGPSLFMMNRDGTGVKRDHGSGWPIYFPTISLSAVLTPGPWLQDSKVVATCPQDVKTTSPTTVIASSPPPTMPAPAIAAPQPAQSTVSYTIADLLAALAKRRDAIDQALNRRHVFFMARTPTGVLLEAKTPDKNDVVRIAELPHSSMSRPDVYANHAGLFFRFVDQAGKAMHIIQLERQKPANDLISLPLVPDLAFENFDCSDDGAEMLFDVRVDEQATIYKYTVATKKTELMLSEAGGGIFPSLSPHGKHFAYIGSGALKVRDIAAKQDTVLAQDDTVKQYPSWSPDGGQVIYQAAGSDANGFNIMAVNTATKEKKTLVGSEGDDLEPTFSPDATRIYFVSDRGQSGFPALFSMNPDGSNQTRDETAPWDVMFPR